MREDFHQENGHSSDLDQKRSGILLMTTNHFSVPRVHCPEECSKAKEVEICQYTFALIRERLKLFFAQLFLLISSVFMEQSQTCVKKKKTCHVRTGRLVSAGQSDPLFVPTSVMKTHTLLTDDPVQEEDLLQKYQERVERLAQQKP